MSRVRSRNTAPEMVVRRSLHAAGFRFRLHRKGLPGRPDLVLPKYHSVIFVHGCFWHGHECPRGRPPATRTEFWGTKIAGNRTRDAAAKLALHNAGWRVLTIWECGITGPVRQELAALVVLCANFLIGTAPEAEISGDWAHPPKKSSENE
ncbi:very short patch repair endonuclease [Nitrospirillum viridazoti]|nr:very short patch repair endonuclease [Nitrospirillum amazonense]